MLGHPLPCVPPIHSDRRAIGSDRRGAGQGNGLSKPNSRLKEVVTGVTKVFEGLEGSY
jgi:hypothetical protein